MSEGPETDHDVPRPEGPEAREPSEPSEAEAGSADAAPLPESPVESPVRDFAERVRAEVARVVVGLDEEIEACLVAVLAQGHVLLEGPPGLAKTLLVRTLAASARRELPAHPVHARPDAHRRRPGTGVFHPEPTATFRVPRGAGVRPDFVLCDEINRAPAKTQAALLEAMQERRGDGGRRRRTSSRGPSSSSPP